MARTNPTVEMLRTVPGLSGLDEKALSRLTSLVSEANVEAGHVLTREDAVGGEVFIIVEGSAEVTRHGEHVATLGPGDFAGEMAVLDNQPRSATVRATTPMRLLVLSPRDFRSFIDTSDGARALALQLAQRLRGASGG